MFFTQSTKSEDIASYMSSQGGISPGEEENESKWFKGRDVRNAFRCVMEAEQRFLSSCAQNGPGSIHRAPPRSLKSLQIKAQGKSGWLCALAFTVTDTESEAGAG